MLSHAKLPKSFWGEAMRLAVNLINLSPSVHLNHDIPQRVWTGKDVSYDYLRVFDYRASVHIPRDERSKLDSKTRQCIFIGFCHEEFRYRFCDLVNKKVIKSRDAVFLEDQTIADFEKSEKPKSSSEELVDSGIIHPPMVPVDDNRGVQVDDTPPDNDELVDENPIEPPVEPQLRRSTRERQPSTDILLVSM